MPQTPHPDMDLFSRYEKLIVFRLDRQDERLDRIEAKLDQLHDDVSAIKTKAAVWGALAGLIAGPIITFALTHLKL